MFFIIYNEWDEMNGIIIFLFVIFVKERIIIIEGDVLCGFMEFFLVVKVVFMGNYENLGEVY